MSISATLSAIIISTVIYGVRFAQIMVHKGLDPSLATYSNPMFVKHFASYRVCVFIGLSINLLNGTAGKFVLTLILVLLLWQSLLLYLFGRQQTQPILYYLMTVSLITQVIVFPNIFLNYAVALMIIAAQEGYLKNWNMTKQSKYDNWVAKTAIRLNKKYSYILKDIGLDDRFRVLHVATTESIARPRLSRIGERMYWYVKRPSVISTGIMQVQSDKPISDAMSMKQGSTMVIDIMRNIPQNLTKPIEQITWLAEKYNGSRRYSVYLLSTHTGLIKAWDKIKKSNI